MRKGIYAAHDRPLTDGHEYDAVHGCPDRAHDTPQQPVHRWPEDATEHPGHVQAEAIAVEVDEEEREQSERESDDPPRNLHSDDPGPLGERRVRVHLRTGPARAGTEVFHPAVVNPAAHPRYL